MELPVDDMQHKPNFICVGLVHEVDFCNVFVRPEVHPKKNTFT